LSGSVRLVGSPMKLSATPVSVRRAPPLLGQHTQEILEQAGLSAERIERLRRAGVI
jgi:crotonobetainyl-CoA:carnitine CoA-transferase CaiB-like acyl-CoA transferase